MRARTRRWEHTHQQQRAQRAPTPPWAGRAPPRRRPPGGERQRRQDDEVPRPGPAQAGAGDRSPGAHLGGAQRGRAPAPSAGARGGPGCQRRCLPSARQGQGRRPAPCAPSPLGCPPQRRPRRSSPDRHAARAPCPSGDARSLADVRSGSERLRPPCDLRFSPGEFREVHPGNVRDAEAAGPDLATSTERCLVRVDFQRRPRATGQTALHPSRTTRPRTDGATPQGGRDRTAMRSDPWCPLGGRDGQTGSRYWAGTPGR